MASAHHKAGSGEGKSPKAVLGIDFEAIKRELANREPVPGDVSNGDWMTMQEISDLMGVSNTQARQLVRKCVGAGIAEVDHRLRPRMGGGMYPCTAYRFKDKWMKRGKIK